MGSVQNARTAVEVLTQSRGRVREARTAVEVLTQQRGKLQESRLAIDVLTKQRGKVREARTAIEVATASRWTEVEWGVPISIVPPPPPFYLLENGTGPAATLGAPAIGPTPTFFRGLFGRDGSGRFGPSVGANENAVFWNIGALEDYEVDVDLVTLGGDAGMLIRADGGGPDGRWILVYFLSNYPIYTHNAGGGGYPMVAAGSGANAAVGDHVKLRVVNEILTVIVNGVTRSSYNFAGITANVPTNAIGFRENFGTVNRYDNLTVVEI